MAKGVATDRDSTRNYIIHANWAVQSLDLFQRLVSSSLLLIEVLFELIWFFLNSFFELRCLFISLGPKREFIIFFAILILTRMIFFSKHNQILRIFVDLWKNWLLILCLSIILLEYLVSFRTFYYHLLAPTFILDLLWLFNHFGIIRIWLHKKFLLFGVVVTIFHINIIIIIYGSEDLIRRLWGHNIFHWLLVARVKVLSFFIFQESFWQSDTSFGSLIG